MEISAEIFLVFTLQNKSWRIFMRRTLLMRFIAGKTSTFQGVCRFSCSDMPVVNMAKLSFFVLIIFFVLSAYNLCVASNTFQKLINLYEQRDFGQLQQELEKLEPLHPDAVEIKFFNALFIKDGHSAKETYDFVFTNGNSVIKNFAAKKLMDYFYAKGYYGKASEYQKYLAENELPLADDGLTANDSQQGIQQDQSQDVYYIQVGAFGMRENARQRCDMLATQHINAEIVIKNTGGKNLFCVWIAGYSSFDETLKYANIIKTKYDLDFRILKK